jgi:hypothetical protein
MEFQTKVLLLIVIPTISLMLMLSATIMLPVQATVPPFNKSNFHNPLKIDNKYFPLKPGTTFVYKGSSDGEQTRDVFTVTNNIKVIIGINAREVHDKAYVNGKLEESTDDWFAQDDNGNVWYFGEFTTDLTTGSHEGSWQAGLKGAKPGIIMLAEPMVGDTYNQEVAKGVAEDKATVLSLKEKVCVPYGCFSNVLKTADFTPLEPDVLEHKFYAQGIGNIKTVQVKGGSGDEQLVQIKGKLPDIDNDNADIKASVDKIQKHEQLGTKQYTQNTNQNQNEDQPAKTKNTQEQRDIIQKRQLAQEQSQEERIKNLTSSNE